MANKSGDNPGSGGKGDSELLGNVNFQKAPEGDGPMFGKPSKSPVKSDGINKPMGDGFTKRQTQWTKRS